MKSPVVNCCMNCKFYHFFTGKCDKCNNKMPPVDLKLPCKDFFYKGGLNDDRSESKAR